MGFSLDHLMHARVLHPFPKSLLFALYFHPPCVLVRDVRTHSYLENEFFARHLQSDIIPGLVEEGVVKSNRYRVVEGKTMLERAQRALDMLRSKEVSVEKLIWRVTDKNDRDFVDVWKSL